MEIQLINEGLLSDMHEKAAESERLRQNFDLRTTPEDGSQRMLNVLEPGTKVAIHRHVKTSETVVCLEGCLDEVFYEELPTVDCGGPVHDGERALRGGGAFSPVPERREVWYPDTENGMAHGGGA